MKKNKKIIIVFLVLAIVAIALWVTRSPNTFRRSLSNFRLDDSTSVTRIFMSDKNNNTVLLTKQAPGKWIVNDKYPAQRLTVEMLLKTLVDIEVSSPVAKAAQDNIIRELAVNSVKVEIYQQVYRVTLFGLVQWWPHEKLTKVYYVGGATPDNQGSFMLMEHSTEPYVVYLPGFRGFVSPRYSPIEKNWRDYNVFKTQITEISRVKVEIPESPDQSFEVRNNGNDRFTVYTLKNEQPLAGYDTLKLLNFLSGFRSLNYEALINDMDKHRKDSILASTPFIIISLTDKKGESRTIKTYHKAGPPGQMDPQGRALPYDLDRLYALVNDGQDFTLIQYFNFDKVLRPLHFFLPENQGRKD